MHIMKRTLHITLVLGISLACAEVLASGFALNEQSISGMGLGFAGRSSSAEDASTVYGNPAGMARLRGQQITGGVALLNASTEISQVSGSSQGSNDGDMVPLTAVPFGFYTQQLDDHWALGFGVYAPFGLVADYEKGFQGSAFGSNSGVKIITLQPTISYAFNDKFSIGFGPTINRVSGALESDIILPQAGSGANQVKIEGIDTALGFNAGLLLQASDTTRVGLTYHSAVKYKLKGHTDINKGTEVPGAILNDGRYDARLSIDTPESWDLSITHDLTQDWRLYAGSTWTRWSRLKDITAHNSGFTQASGFMTPTLFGTITEEQDWHDTWAHAIGTSYRIHPDWVLRTGLAFDQSPTNNTHRSPRIPSGDRTIFSLGAGYNLTPSITLDMAYAYLREESVHVSSSNALGASYNAKFANSAHGVGLGMSYRF